MLQFINGTDEAFADLETRAQHACVVFHGQMPPGVTPASARVGFEVESEDGSAMLLVDRNLRYVGGSRALEQWFAEGVLRFESFQQLREWIQSDLKAVYDGSRGEVSYTVQQADNPVLESITDMPRLREELETSRRLDSIDEESLYNALLARVRGQDEALRILSRRVSRHISKQDPARPLTVFATGPTGVGKTQTAESLAAAFGTDGGNRFGYLRIDCSEYSERHRVSHLLGAPPGYIGYGDSAPLADVLVTSPKCVILFDEIEKAHPDILRTLMNAMDAGRLTSTSATGQRTLDCRQAVFFFTSNVSSTAILQETTAQDAFEDASLIDSICRPRLVASGIQPELVGRIGCFLVFKPLSRAAQAEIIALSIIDVGREYGVTVTRIEPEVITSILDSLPSCDFGARPARTLIEDTLGAVLAEARSTSGQTVNLIGPPYACLSATSGSGRDETSHD